MKNLIKVVSLMCVTLFFIASNLAAEIKKNDLQTSDLWLQSKLVTTYLLNEHLSIFDIDTDVKNQVVYLSGHVNSAIDKDLAGEVAKSIEGVRNVENNLTVIESKTTKEIDHTNIDVQRSFGRQIDDMTTTASIKTKFLSDENISGLKINVGTFNGTVTLEGEVASKIEKDLAEKIAENTKDVTEVKNMLKVVSHS